MENVSNYILKLGHGGDPGGCEGKLREHKALYSKLSGYMDELDYPDDLTDEVFGLEKLHNLPPVEFKFTASSQNSLKIEWDYDPVALRKKAWNDPTDDEFVKLNEEVTEYRER
jgi:hypothetical protein